MLLVIFVIFGFVSCHAQKDVYGVVGKSVVLQCESQDKWKRENLKIEVFNTTKVSFYGNNLEIKNLADEDFTTYSCDENSFRLLKGELPVLTKGFEMKSELQGESITLECQASALPKLKTISWSFNGKTVTANSNMKVETLYGANNIVTGRLKIQNATLQNNGNFTCSGSNDLPGSFSHTRKVNIYAMSLFTILPKPKYDVVEGTMLIAVCEVLGNPIQSLIWRLNNKPIMENPKKMIQVLSRNKTMYLLRNTLSISDVDQNDQGKLECQVHDFYSEKTTESIINVFELPQPLDFVVVNITKTSMFINWTKATSKDSLNSFFKITYKPTNNQHSFIAQKTSHHHTKLKNLTPNTNYSVCLFNVNPVGKSEGVCKILQTKNLSIWVSWSITDEQVKVMKFSSYDLNSSCICKFELNLSRTENLHSTQPAALSISVLNIHPNNVTLLLTRKDNLTSQEMLQRRIIISYSSNTGGLSKNITLNLPDEKSFEYNVEQLKPYTEYTFYVNERVATLDGKISNITVNTSEAAPSKPRNLTITFKDSTSITLTWEKPLHLNGKIREFKVIYYFYVDGNKNDKLLVTTNVTKREIKISDLYPHVKYTFYVYEKTTEYGPYAEVSDTTLSSVPQAAPRNLRIQDKTSNSVRFRWDPLPFFERGDEGFGYLIKYANKDGSIPEKKVFPKAETTSVLLNDLMPYTEYELSIGGTNNQGPGKSAKLTFTTRASAPSAPRNVTGVAFKSSIKLTWMPPANMNGQPDLFQVVYRKVLSCAHVRCKREMPFGIDFAENGSLPLSGNRWHYIDRILDPYSLYSIDVRESTKNGGWGNYSSPGVDVLTNIASPTKPLNVSAVSVSDTSVTVTWEEPDMPNGRMISYKIVTYFGSSILKEDIYTLAQNIPYQLKFTVEGLKSESTYVVQIQGFNTHLGDPSDRLYVKTAAPAPSFPWLFVLIGCLATVLLIACMVTVFIFMSRRNSRNTMYKNVKTKEEIVVNNAQQAKAIHITDLKQYCSDHHANSDFLYHEEFESVVVPTSNYSFEHSRMPYNQSKNRYSNVLPYDHSRVTLNPIDNEVGSSYINANFIDGYKHNKKYIATQGPLPETVLDFWRMVWEQNVPIIVMLTKLVEDNRLKCEQYWPPGDGLQYKDIVVKVLSVSELTDYTIRIFQVYKFNNPSAGQRIIRQYHYTAWPDHGVPSHPTSMLSFVRHVMNYHEIGRLNIENAKALEGPIIVHCSAGVGRTGTFIAIEGCLKQIEEEQQVDVYGSVYRMRKQRNYMVQTEHQYTFIYDALLDSVICGNTEIAPADLVSKIRFLNERDPATGETNFAAEFKRLECGILQKDVKQFGEANHLENKQKNRFLNILPFDKNRVRLTPIAGIRHSDYINASVIDGFQQKNTFIASQAPLENTVNDFWRMIVERSVHIIVMLTKLEEKGQDKCYLYWPQASTVSYGKVLVGFIDSIEEESVVIHHLRVTDKETQRSWTVIHFNYLGWPEYGSPDNGTEIIHLIGRVQAAHRSIKSEAGPILVHCSGGVGRTGVFISVFNSIERLKAKDVVDIFQTTRALRLQRTAMVQTIDQYIFCYQALKDYLDSFDLYANTKC